MNSAAKRAAVPVSCRPRGTVPRPRAQPPPLTGPASRPDTPWRGRRTSEDVCIEFGSWLRPGIPTGHSLENRRTPEVRRQNGILIMATPRQSSINFQVSWKVNTEQNTMMCRFSAPSFRKTCRPSSPPTAYEQETCVSDFFLRPKLECTLQSDPGFRRNRQNASKPDILDSMHLILLDVHQLQATAHATPSKAPCGHALLACLH